MSQHSAWKTNLTICIALLVMVGGYFFYQVDSSSKQFRKNSREHSKVLAAAVELNIRNAIRSNQGLELILTDFLRNSARFISYLNVIERFTATELSAFAKESGLSGIAIVTEGKSEVVVGPLGWSSSLTCADSGALRADTQKHLYTLAYAADSVIGPEADCVIVGFSSRGVEQVQKDISVEQLLERLAQLPGIVDVEMVPLSKEGSDEEVLATLTVDDGRKVSRTRIGIGDQELIVSQEARHFLKRLKQMRTEFFLFIVFFTILGALSSWWLYHSQRQRLRQTRMYEQEMARQHEQAALGRAAATIAHEIRNPLNAIGMGLQRLQLEAGGLNEEHRALVSAMREAVTRSNTIITDLQRYARSFELEPEPVALAALIRQVAGLYVGVCSEQGVELTLPGDDGKMISADRNLLGQLFENLLKNVVEAQPEGGFCRISLYWSSGNCRVEICNGGFLLSEQDSSDLFQPYFTSKTQGTGLGLTICQKIVEAHGGNITAYPDALQKQLLLAIELPNQDIS